MGYHGNVITLSDKEFVVCLISDVYTNNITMTSLAMPTLTHLCHCIIMSM